MSKICVEIKNSNLINIQQNNIQLPIEIISHISTYVSDKNILSFSLTCNIFHSIISLERNKFFYEKKFNKVITQYKNLIYLTYEHCYRISENFGMVLNDVSIKECSEIANSFYFLNEKPLCCDFLKTLRFHFC
uniref:F-box domain-containing protein n=1 Tax=viral metagenome TaxID=1070528 RepID=A0A6C0LUW1_9ZZZZ